MIRVTYDLLLRAALQERMPVHAALRVLRDRGASPAEAAQAVGAVTGESPADCAAMVRASGAWDRPRGDNATTSVLRRCQDGVGRHGRSGRGAATVLPHLVSPYVVRPAPDRGSRA